MEELKILSLDNFTRDFQAINKEKMFNEVTNILVETINLVRNCEYLKKINLSNVFNKYFDEITGKFDSTRKNEFLNEFVQKVPVSEYKDYKELIDRIHDKGESDIMLPGLPSLFALSSGTLSGNGKIFPLFWQNHPGFEKMKMAMMKGIKPPYPPENIIDYVNQAGFKEFSNKSKGICLITRYIKSFSPIKNIPIGMASSSIPSYASDIEPEFPKYDMDYNNRILTALIFSASFRDLEFIYSVFLSTVADFFSFFEREFFTVIQHIENGTLPEPKQSNENNYMRMRNDHEASECKLKPNKERADELRMLADGDKVDLKNRIHLIWPKLSLINAIYTGSFEPTLHICRSYCSNVLYLNTIYISSEGFHGDALPNGKNHYLLFKPNTGKSFLEFIPENSNNVLLPTELEVDKTYEVIVTSPISGLLRYKLGDIVKMCGWFENLPVISVVGRKDISLRNNIYQVKEEEFINCFHELNLNVQFTFFMDRMRNPACLGVFLENSNEITEKKEELSIKIHQYLMANNSAYNIASSKNVSVPISVYYVRKGSFMEWNSFKAEQIGIKSTNQVKLTRISLSEEQIDFFRKRIE